jgi:serine/threonine protein kinase
MAATDDTPQPAPSNGGPSSNREDETTVDLDPQDHPVPDERGRTFGDYTLLEKIGTSGTSVLYKALSNKLGRVVSLEIQGAGAAVSEHHRERFVRCVRAAAPLRHPHIAAVCDVGQHEGRTYVAMEYVPGQTLAQLGAGQPLPAPRAAKYVLKIAEAIEYAHERGVLHLDLCLRSVIVDENDQPHPFSFESAARRDPYVTMGPACIVGRPAYMSPEQACGKQNLIGPRSDKRPASSG